MNKNVIRLIVLDLDGTLYDINDVISTVYRYQVEFLSKKLGKTPNEIEVFLDKHSIFPYVTKETKSATELFAQIGIDKEEWKEYRNSHFDVSAVHKEKAVEGYILHHLSEKYLLVLLSSNTMTSIKKVLSHLDIPKEYFVEVVCSDFFPSEQVFNKKEAMKYLSNKYDIPFHTMLSIGDRYQTDIKPMVELGGVGILIKSPKYFDKIYLDIERDRLASCTEYELYNNNDKQ